MNKAYNDMYIIAALVAYGFEQVGVDDRDKNKQKYLFPSDQERKVFTIQPDGRSRWDMLTPDAVSQAYGSDKLLFPPNYPQVLRRVKYQIISTKHEDEQGTDYGA